MRMKTLQGMIMQHFFEKDIHDSHNSIESDKYLEDELHRVITQSINGG